MSNRKKAEAFILQFLKDIEPTGYNVEQYNEIFKNLSDKDFDIWMKGIQSGDQSIVFFKPMYKAKGVTVENNLKIGAKYGVEFFERLLIENDPNKPDHMTPNKYLVIDLPLRRQSQTLYKKISLPDDNKTVDELTYQPTGASKGAKISYPELQVLMGMGLDKTITELTQFRGGDKGGFNAYNSMMGRYGSVDLKALSSYSTGVESTKTLKTYLLAMHIQPQKG